VQITGSVKTGANPDCILYEPGHKEVYTFNGRDSSATVFDAATGDVKATIALPGKPEFAVVDVKAGRIYNNIEDTKEIVVIDTNTHAVVARWPIAPGEGASGLAIDLEHHRLYTVAGNKLLVALDSGTGKVLSTLPIGPGVDAAAYDPATGFVFASSSDSTLTVAKADAAGKLALVQTLATPPRSRTMTLDPTTHRIYVSAAEFTAPPPAAPGAQPQRPQMVPGSFKVVVYEMTGQVAGQKPSAEWQQAFAVGAADLATVGESTYLVLTPGYQLTLEGRESGKTVRLVITVLDETKIVGGIETRVVEERESENGALVEVSRNYMAIDKTTRDVYYLGEDVDVYKGGKVVNHEGAWLHGTAGAKLGLLVPAAPVVGQRYYQEVAPKVAMDRAEVVSVSERMTTPAGTFERCLKTEESTPLEPGREAKLYAPGVGLVKDASLVLISFTKR
jgi:DNA-binding beta-propeller fold protein YncE